MLKTIGGIVVAIALGLGWWGFSSWQAKADAPEVGECVTMTGSATDADLEEKECGGDGILYEVMSDDGKCDLEARELNYTVSVRGNDAVDLCLYWNVEEGDCVRLVESPSEPDEKVACTETGTETEPVLKVVSVNDGAGAKCDKPAVSFPNKTRDTTICLAVNG